MQHSLPNGHRSDEEQQLIPLTRTDLWAALFLALITIGSCLYLRVPGVTGTFDDDGIYLATARSIAEGTGYRIASLPDMPAQTKYPPVFPLLLAGVWKLAPELPGNVTFFQLISMISAALAAACGYCYAVQGRYAGRGPAFCGILCCSTSNYYLYYGTQVLSELPFSALLLLALWSAERLLQAPRTSRALLCGLLIALACLTRSIGLFVAAPLIVYLGRFSFKALPVVVLPLLLLMVPWQLWAAGGAADWAGNPLRAYYTSYGGWAEDGIRVLHRVVLYNFATMTFFFSQLLFEGIITASAAAENATAGEMAALASSVFLWAGYFRGATRRLGFVTVAPYLLLLLVWPGPPLRLLVPLLPIILPQMMSGALQLVGACSRVVPRAAKLLLGLGIALNIWALQRYHAQHERTGFPALQLLQQEVEWKSYQELFDWIETNTEREVVLAAVYDSMVYLYTGRRSFHPYLLYPARWIYGSGDPPYGTIEELCGIYDAYGADYVVLTAKPSDAKLEKFRELIEELARRYPQKLTKVYSGAPGFAVYRITARFSPECGGSDAIASAPVRLCGLAPCSRPVRRSTVS